MLIDLLELGARVIAGFVVAGVVIVVLWSLTVATRIWSAQMAREEALERMRDERRARYLRWLAETEAAGAEPWPMRPERDDAAQR